MPTVFFSWQIDTPPREGRNFIDRALERATSRISSDTTVEEAVRDLLVDRDTKGVAGSPPIVDTIFKKIDEAAVFVPDLTFIAKRPDGRPTPNPNVLIEYGWALKSHSHGRIVPVMNTAFGEPIGDAMPFDMRHLRNPITYHCPDDADEEYRKRVSAKLSKELEAAIRAVLDSSEFKTTLPASAEFKPITAADGRGRFKSADEVIGISRAGSWGGTATELRLSPKPLVWLRVMPTADPGRGFSVDELEKAVKAPPMLQPISRDWSGYNFLRTHEGYGVYSAFDDSQAIVRAIVFAFATGEVWSSDSYWLEGYRDGQNRPTVPQLDREFRQALVDYGRFLEVLGIKPPYKWIVGMEDMKGRVLYIPAPPGHSRLGTGPNGQCIAETIIKSGLYSPGDSPAEILKPFFSEIYNSCGEARREWQDK